jgi:hypothetical protein
MKNGFSFQKAPQSLGTSKSWNEKKKFSVVDVSLGKFPIFYGKRSSKIASARDMQACGL